jgi:hypothetical protein
MRIWVTDVRICVGRPLVAPPDLDKDKFAVHPLAQLSTREARAVAARFGSELAPRSRNYVDYEDRMAFIVAFFRVWQGSGRVLTEPYTPNQEVRIVSGRLIDVRFWKDW